MLNILSRDNEYWYCNYYKEIFPYHSILDDEFTFLHTDIGNTQEHYELLNKCKDLKLTYDSYFDYNVGDMNAEVDPDSNFLAEIDKSCDYYTNAEFNTKIKCSDKFSLIHLNCRSIKANFKDMQTFIDTLQIKFDIIAVSETWLSDTDDLNDFLLPNYELVNVNKKNKRGGGVL